MKHLVQQLKPIYLSPDSKSYPLASHRHLHWEGTAPHAGHHSCVWQQPHVSQGTTSTWSTSLWTHLPSPPPNPCQLCGVVSTSFLSKHTAKVKRLTDIRMGSVLAALTTGSVWGGSMRRRHLACPLPSKRHPRTLQDWPHDCRYYPSN